ncbi:AAA family ATPase [Candidatus Bathyarchaeota archaeon]|nr:AAA family ATPase [Candidatus Bathyarchaeota archaeon]
MNEVVRSVLGALILKAQLIENADLTSNDFPAGREREVFRAIAEIWEQSRNPGIIPDAAIAEKISGDGPVAYVCSLTVGNIPKTPAAFALLVSNLRRRRLIEQAFKLAHDENERAVKLGENDPGKLEEIEKAFAEITAFGEKGFDPEKVLMTGEQLQAIDIKVEWTIEKLIPSRSLTVLHGPGGLGKTWLALAMIEAVAKGAPFLGLKTKQRPIVYVDFENPLPMLIDRVRALDIREARFWHLSFTPPPPKFDTPKWTLYKKLQSGSLVVIDTARACHDGDENSSQDVGLLMGRLKEIRELGNDVLLLHHTTKLNEQAAKGSTAWDDLADHVLAFFKVRHGSLKEIDDGELDPEALFHLGSRKTRYEAVRLFLTFNLKAGGFALANDPNTDLLNALAKYIASEGYGKNQTEIIEWARVSLGGSRKESLVNLLKRGEREGRWRSCRGLKGAKLYEPPT